MAGGSRLAGYFFDHVGCESESLSVGVHAERHQICVWRREVAVQEGIAFSFSPVESSHRTHPDP